MRFFIVLLCIPVFWAVHFSHQGLIQQLPLKEDINGRSLFPAEFLQLTSLGHDAMAADILWLQLIQYYGAAVQTKQPADQLYNYFNTLTTLAPHFENAYIFSAYLIPEYPDLVMKLLEKGIKNNPKNADIMFQAGFIAYQELKENKIAAEYFQKASELPNAPSNSARIAAELYAKSDKQALCSVSLSLLQRAIAEAPDAASRERTEKQFIERRILCDLRQLNQQVQNYIQQQKKAYTPSEEKGKEAPRPPASFAPKDLNTLVKAGLLEGIPQDPLKRNYLYRGGKVKAKTLPWPTLEAELKPYLVP
jgi:hypothetical protein